MDNEKLILQAAVFAVDRLMDKGSSSYGTLNSKTHKWDIIDWRIVKNYLLKRLTVVILTHEEEKDNDN